MSPQTKVPGPRTVISADGLRIAYDVTGDGEPALVFVHGWSGRRGHWNEQVELFASDHLVVRVDLGGHGASGLGRERWTVASFAGDVVAVVDALALDRVIIIGHSLGGTVIVAAARYLAPRVRVQPCAGGGPVLRGVADLDAAAGCALCASW